jgi:hypothetical protein
MITLSICVVASETVVIVVVAVVLVVDLVVGATDRSVISQVLS